LLIATGANIDILCRRVAEEDPHADEADSSVRQRGVAVANRVIVDQAVIASASLLSVSEEFTPRVSSGPSVR
jgi:hypothetical protein